MLQSLFSLQQRQNLLWEPGSQFWYLDITRKPGCINPIHAGNAENRKQYHLEILRSYLSLTGSSQQLKRTLAISQVLCGCKVRGSAVSLATEE